MKFVLYLSLVVGAHLSAAEERNPQASVTGPSLDGDEDPMGVVTDPAGNPYLPDGRESYYTKYYKAANLPSLRSLRVDKGMVLFRVAIFPSFSKPLFLSYARDKVEGVVSVVRLSGRPVGNTQPGTVELQGAVRINSEAAEAFEKLAAWSEVRDPLSSLDDRLLPLYQGLDGTTWILEVVTSEGYTMVDIQSPDSFEYHENELRGHYEREIRKNPKAYNLPESFKDYDLPDLDISVFASFCEDLLKIVDMTVPSSRGDERPSQRVE